MLTTESIARSLGGVARNGTGWVACCPVPRHGRGRGDRNPSLSVSDMTKKEVAERKEK